MDALSALDGEDFQSRAQVIATADALARFLRDCSEVTELRAALSSGQLTGNHLRKYVKSLIRAFDAGMRFPHEINLAAIAVALERSLIPFANEYIRDLSALKVAEVPLASRVARLVLKRRHMTVAGHTHKILVLLNPVISNDYEVKEARAARNRIPTRRDVFDLRESA